MIIRTEPKDWSMYSVLLYFDTQSPDAEDDAIRQYLADNKLEPKRQTTQQLADREFNVMSFGGCYLGPRHTKAMAEIQRGVVEKELLSESIPSMLKEGPDSEASRLASEMNGDAFQAIVDELVMKYQQPSSFGQDSEGYLKTALNAEDVRAAFLEAVKANQNV